jgi:hypothetical protein
VIDFSVIWYCENGIEPSNFLKYQLRNY